MPPLLLIQLYAGRWSRRWGRRGTMLGRCAASSFMRRRMTLELWEPTRFVGFAMLLVAVMNTGMSSAPGPVGLPACAAGPAFFSISADELLRALLVHGLKATCISSLVDPNATAERWLSKA